MSQFILRLPAVKQQTGLSRSTIYGRISQRLWPRPVSIGPRAVGWPADEVALLNAARISGKSDVEIRALVAGIESARPNSFSTFNPNSNQNVVEGRDQFIAEVRDGKRKPPRQKGTGRPLASCKGGEA